jgi:hypothetical protein
MDESRTNRLRRRIQDKSAPDLFSWGVRWLVLEQRRVQEQTPSARALSKGILQEAVYPVALRRPLALAAQGMEGCPVEPSRKNRATCPNNGWLVKGFGNKGTTCSGHRGDEFSRKYLGCYGENHVIMRSFLELT